MADKTVDVRTRLKLDDLASALLGRIQQGFKATDAEQKKTSGGFKDFARSAASAFLAFNAVPAIKGVLDYGKSFVSAAAGAEAGKREFQGLLGVVQGIPFGEAGQQAAKLADEFNKVALRTGVAGGEIREGFAALVEVTGAGADGIARAKKEIADMATISGVMGKSTEGIAREFGFMQEGILKTKGQMFQMLQHTGIFGDNVKKASESWAKLTEEERAKRLEEGLGKVALRFQNVKPGFNQMLAQLDTMYSSIKKDVGQPVMEALSPALSDLVQRFASARGEIKQYAKTIGTEVGRWVTDAAKRVEQGFQYLKSHEAEIRDAIEAGVAKAKSLVEFILANKEEIAIAFGAKAILPGALGAGKSVATAAGGYLGAAKGGVEGLGLAGSTAGSLAALGALSLAIVGVGLAAWQASKLVAELIDHTDTVNKGFKVMADTAKAGDVASLERQLNAMMLVKQEAGEVTPQLHELAAALRANAEAAQMSKLTLHDDRVGRIQREMAMITDAYRQAASIHTAAADQLAESVAVKGASALVDAYNEASRAGDQGAAAFAAQTLGSSRILIDALIKAGVDVEGGFEGLANTLVASGSQFADVASRLRAAAGGTAGGAKQTVNFSGGQSFKINQEFREGDPDKIAIAFRRDILKSAERRYQASSTSPFGT